MVGVFITLAVCVVLVSVIYAYSKTDDKQIYISDFDTSKGISVISCLIAAILGFASYFCTWLLAFAYLVLVFLMHTTSENYCSYIKGTEINVWSLLTDMFLSAFSAIIPYALFQVWWFFIGDDYFNGGLFALAQTPAELFWSTIMFLVIVLYFLSFFILKK